MIQCRQFILLLCITLLLYGCTSYPNIENREPTFSYKNTQNTTLGKLYAKKLNQNNGKSGFFPLGEGEDAFAIRSILANRAERSIDAQYYLLKDDYIGRLFTSILIKAADRGVRVRLLLDGAGFDGFSDNKLSYIDAHPNIEIRYFNPFKPGLKYLQFLTRMKISTRRMHNKSMIVDNQVAIVGGRNIGSEYFSADQMVNYGDLDSISIGPVVKKVTNHFDQYWNSSVVYNITKLTSLKPKNNNIQQHLDKVRSYLKDQENIEYINKIESSQLAKDVYDNSLTFFWGYGEVLADAPEKVLHNIKRTDLHMSEKVGFQFQRATEEVIIFNPYFIPGKSGTQGLIELIKRGIKVKVLTNSLASMDQTAVYAHYSKYRKKLLQAGVEIYEALPQQTAKKTQFKKNNTLHAKSFIIDRKYVFIGSMNFDARSAFENTEIGIVFNSKEMAEGMANWFDSNVRNEAYTLKLNESGKTTWIKKENDGISVYQHEPETTIWRRIEKWLLRLIPMESML